MKIGTYVEKTSKFVDKKIQIFLNFFYYFFGFYCSSGITGARDHMLHVRLCAPSFHNWKFSAVFRILSKRIIASFYFTLYKTKAPDDMHLC